MLSKQDNETRILERISKLEESVKTRKADLQQIDQQIVVIEKEIVVIEKRIAGRG